MFYLGPAVCMGTQTKKTIKNQRRARGLGRPKIGIFGPKTRGGPCADLPRSSGIISSPKTSIRPYSLMVYFFFSKQKTKTNMKIKLFGHPLNPRALGPRLWKRAQNCIQDGLNESSVHPNGTSVMPPILRSRSTQKFLKYFCLRFGLFLESLETSSG